MHLLDTLFSRILENKTRLSQLSWEIHQNIFILKGKFIQLFELLDSKLVLCNQNQSLPPNFDVCLHSLKFPDMFLGLTEHINFNRINANYSNAKR